MARSCSLQDGRPGLMARMVRIEDRLDVAEEELRLNRCSSIKDQWTGSPTPPAPITPEG
ncbi:hypothetical protein [Salinispora arenicola]|uniref:hypothetical protein n=1 Tax=Salinispora arenicola TaxID=168697 RepID=UPI00036CC26E|nr:hypothetical protein [Salinispora arenicola]MCN0155173.1 hypothetical protein [Salinispora arenicola]